MVTHKINEEINHKEVTLISHDGENLGKIGIDKAIELSNENNLDLVLMSEDPPVCKILDYQKFLYQAKKKLKNKAKNSKTESIKEIKIGATIHEHDLEVKIKKIKELLAKGHKVRIFCLLRTRQIALRDNVHKNFNRIYQEVNSFNDAPDDFIKTSNGVISAVL